MKARESAGAARELIRELLLTIGVGNEEIVEGDEGTGYGEEEDEEIDESP